MLLWEADEPNHVENVDGLLDVKVAALLAHESQHRTTMGIDDKGTGDKGADAGHGAFRAVMAAQLAAHGQVAGLAAGEAFRLLTEL